HPRSDSRSVRRGSRRRPREVDHADDVSRHTSIEDGHLPPAISRAPRTCRASRLLTHALRKCRKGFLKRTAGPGLPSRLCAITSFLRALSRRWADVISSALSATVYSHGRRRMRRLAAGIAIKTGARTGQRARARAPTLADVARLAGVSVAT